MHKPSFICVMSWLCQSYAHPFK